jgi:HAD superfamily hydrolase (TIGR01509 family)
VTGGRERLLYDMAARTEAPPLLAAREALAGELHQRKNAIYADIVAQGGIAARPGVLHLMNECAQTGVLMAVATTTSTSNVVSLFSNLLGADWRARFAAVVCAEDAPIKKPDPQAYLMALQWLKVPAQDAFALEDSPNGLLAARAAGIACGITRSAYFADAKFEGATWVRDDLASPQQMTLLMLNSP